jgi:hypothetical protein
VNTFADIHQYLLTASLLVAPVVASYAIFSFTAKLLAKLTGSSYRLSWLAHLGSIIAACALAPFIALFTVARPADLMASGGKFLLTGAIASFIVVAFVEEFARSRRKSKTND